MFAFILDSVGFGEWFVLLAVVLIVVGPKDLPRTARKLAQYMSRFRRAAESFRRQLMEMEEPASFDVGAMDDAMGTIASTKTDEVTKNGADAHQGS